MPDTTQLNRLNVLQGLREVSDKLDELSYAAHEDLALHDRIRGIQKQVDSAFDAAWPTPENDADRIENRKLEQLLERITATPADQPLPEAIRHELEDRQIPF